MASLYLTAASKIVGPLVRCRYCRRRGSTLLENRAGTWLVWRCRWCGEVRHSRPLKKAAAGAVDDVWLSDAEWRELSALTKRHGDGIYDVLPKCWPGTDPEEVPQDERFHRELLTRLRQLEPPSGPRGKKPH